MFICARGCVPIKDEIYYARFSILARARIILLIEVIIRYLYTLHIILHNYLYIYGYIQLS
jgi:hypothetical protein